MGFFKELRWERERENFFRLNIQLINAFDKSFQSYFGISLNLHMDQDSNVITDYDDNYGKRFIEIEFDVRNQRALVFLNVYTKYYNNKYDGFVIKDNSGNYTYNYLTGKHIYLYQYDPDTGNSFWTLLEKMNRQQLFDRMVRYGCKFGGYKNLKIEELRNGTSFDSLTEMALSGFSYEMVYEYGFQKGYKNVIND